MALPDEIYAVLNDRYPFSSAYEWDNSGWQVMTGREVERCLFALDPSPEAIRQAIDQDVQLIVTHHPLILPSISAIDPSTVQGAIAKILLGSETGLLAAHTNVDRQLDGVSGALADLIGLEDQQILAPDEQETLYKLVTFVPDEYTDRVRAGLGAAGAGVIGNYEECSFTIAGVGSYRPTSGARPLVGEVGQMEHVNEQRLEMLVPEAVVDQAIEALRLHHPYDEVAFDLYQTFGQGGVLGSGVIGVLPEPLDIMDTLAQVKEVMGGIDLQVSGPAEGTVQLVAVAGGSTSGLLGVAASRGAHLFIGGDLKYHDISDAADSMVCVDAGHRATEQPGVERLAEIVRRAVVSNHWDLEVEVFLEDPAMCRIF
ncbi:Nif3-like dinuclear metal center hexameric protein [Candidatus Zixiibacteriota bacterium]